MNLEYMELNGYRKYLDFDEVVEKDVRGVGKRGTRNFLMPTLTLDNGSCHVLINASIFL
jgi:hypothetical protein